SRLMLYRGDVGETFCLAVAEAQALGLPAVVQDLGSLNERVIHDTTGKVTQNNEEFAAAAIEILRNDQLWRQMHQASLAQQRGLSWNEIAQCFENLMK
ncbi:MAG TPA: glycosyltransferase, partial [Coxiellaceae bacterium]|nr:glycosyltransferase [Coxiellaceae bacterium]